MIFKKMSRNSPETAFIVVKNVSGSTITAGYSCVFDVGASVDGVRVSQADTVDLQAYAGVADSDIADSAFGLVQVYGYRATTYIYSSTGSSVAGDNLVVVNSDWGLTPATSGGTAKAFGFLCEAITASTSSQYHLNAKAFLRAL
jgi:hypothetical protein